FHKVYHALNQFCAVDLSSLYIDITKDRMYCDAADSARRRATQMVMHEILGALCRLLAPVLVFTAEESWRHSALGGSIHLQEFPPLEHRGHEASDWKSRLIIMRNDEIRMMNDELMTKTECQNPNRFRHLNIPASFVIRRSCFVI